MPATFWDMRYRQADYAYGETPNRFLYDYLPSAPSLRLLFAAEGEGRNAVYAAHLGHQVSAFDISRQGREKALKLAERYSVCLDYQVGNLPELAFQNAQFDGLVLIYAHFPLSLRQDYYRRMAAMLPIGGVLWFEGFSFRHSRYQVKNPALGGPSDPTMLFNTADLRFDFDNFEFLMLEDIDIELNEGLYHNGTAAVIRAIARKIR